MIGIEFGQKVGEYPILGRKPGMVAQLRRKMVTLGLLALVAACVVGSFSAIFNLIGRLLP
jgi:hypothetical protein